MKRNKKLNLNKILSLLKNNYILTILFCFIYFLFLNFYSLSIKNNILNQSKLVINIDTNFIEPKGELKIFDDESFDTSCNKINFTNFIFVDAIKVCLVDHIKAEFLKKNITTQFKDIRKLYLYSNEKLNEDILKKQLNIVSKKIFNKKKFIDHINQITQKRLDYHNNIISLLDSNLINTQQEIILNRVINNELNFNFNFNEYLLASEEYNIIYKKLVVTKSKLLKQQINNLEFVFSFDEIPNKLINNTIINYILLILISVVLSFLTIIILSFKLPKFIK